MRIPTDAMAIMVRATNAWSCAEITCHCHSVTPPNAVVLAISATTVAPTSRAMAR